MSLVSAEMEEAVGISHLYPIVPIMNILSMGLMLLLLPGFWKTRIFALVALVGWIFIGNLLFFVCMIRWRGNVDDVPIWADIFAAVGRVWNLGSFSSIACFSKFTWERLQPLPVRQLYDKRRRDNVIAAFLTIACPLLMIPSFILYTTSRYMIIEDFGPLSYYPCDWLSLVLNSLPRSIYCVVIITFNTVTLVSYCRLKQENFEPRLSKHESSVRTRKLLLMSLMNTPLAAYGAYTPWRELIHFGWSERRPMTEIVASLQVVLYLTKPELDTDFKENANGLVRMAIFMPLFGFYLFAWFGLGKEARKAYGDTLMEGLRLMGITHKECEPLSSASPLSWPSVALRKLKLQSGSSIPETAPFPLAIPGDASRLSANAARSQSTEPVGNVIDNKRHERALTREPEHRRSIHRLPFAPPALAYSIPNTTQNPSESMPQFSRDVKIRQQRNSSPYARARRLSCHKPAFSPLAPMRVRIPEPDAVGTSMPHFDVQRKHKRSRATGLPAESTVETPSPPFPTFSTSMAPPPPSYQRPATPAPPYEDMNPFTGDTP